MSTLTTLRTATSIAAAPAATSPTSTRIVPATMPPFASRSLLLTGPAPLPTPVVGPDVRTRGGHAVKRALDITVSLVALILLAPVMLAVAVAVKRSSPGPMFFLQERIGRDGKAFKVIKFRSMRVGTDLEVRRDAIANRRYQENGFKLAADDPRITRVGRLIRATSLDELPQLINVLRGEMSLVGIRPLLADELALRDEYDQACYRALRPGLTGLWQVSGRSSTTNVDRHRLDREYIESWSFEADLLVLLRTPLALIRTGQTC